ncbi:hypothetical protein BC828DRAFT_375863 [Blastocladiella britannica]|nr:hypothetical protein BC828DRAFT_375863 [Blastocladiella britannica]
MQSNPLFPNHFTRIPLPKNKRRTMPYIPGSYDPPPASSMGRAPATAAGGGFALGSGPANMSRMGVTSRAGGASTSYSRAGPTSGGGGTSGDGKRPMTSNRAAGFSTRAGRPTTAGMAAFNPLRSTPGAPGSGAAGTDLASGSAEPSPEDQVRDTERAIFALLHASAVATAAGQPASGLAKAKEAAKRERALLRTREQLSLMDTVNLDLTYCVLVNLAHQFAASGMPAEAIATYTTVVKNKTFHQSSRLRVNMGNLYASQNKWSLAIKMYRMALDQLPPAHHRDLRAKVMHNLSSALMRAGHVGDAVTALETILETKPDHKAAFHLVLCAYALGDREKMRRAFGRLVAIPYPTIEADPDAAMSGGRGAASASVSHAHRAADPAMGGGVVDVGSAGTLNDFAFTYPQGGSIDDSLFTGDDPLRALQRSAVRAIERQVLLAGKLVASAIAVDEGPNRALSGSRTNISNTMGAGGGLGMMSRNPSAGTGGLTGDSMADGNGSGGAAGDGIGSAYDWVLPLVRASPAAAVAAELDMAKAVHHLRARNVTAAATALRELARRAADTAPLAVSMSMTNLSFLALLEGDHEAATRHAEEAVSRDRYNARAHSNRGMAFMMAGDLSSARDMFLEAVSLDAECAEAAFNLGITYKQMGQVRDALKVFEKLHGMLRGSPEVVANLAELHERLGSLPRALEWYSVLVSVVPTDAGVLAKLGAIHDRLGEAAQAAHYYAEAHRYDPAHMDALAWLAAHHVKCECYEAAVPLFDRLLALDPGEIQWPLMAASCHRRAGNYPAALEMYRGIHDKWPSSVEALRFLVRVATDVSAKELPVWQDELAKLESRGSGGNGGANGTARTAGAGGMTGGMAGAESLGQNTAGAGPPPGDRRTGVAASIAAAAASNNSASRESLLTRQATFGGTASNGAPPNYGGYPKKQQQATWEDDKEEYNVDEMLP